MVSEMPVLPAVSSVCQEVRPFQCVRNIKLESRSLTATTDGRIKTFEIIDTPQKVAEFDWTRWPKSSDCACAINVFKRKVY